MSFQSRFTFKDFSGVAAYGPTPGDPTLLISSIGPLAIPPEANGCLVRAQQPTISTGVKRTFRFTLDGSNGRPLAECFETDELVLTNRAQCMALAVGAELSASITFRWFTGRSGSSV